MNEITVSQIEEIVNSQLEAERIEALHIWQACNAEWQAIDALRKMAVETRRYAAAASFKARATFWNDRADEWAIYLASLNTNAGQSAFVQKLVAA